MTSQIVSVYKRKGISSYDVIRQLKRKYPGEKIGHGGTLDPLAEGVLVVAIGRESTKRLHDVLNGTDKEYEVTIELGKISETDDAEGPIHDYSEEELVQPTEEMITAVLKNYIGHIDQTPPVYSAVKIQGKPAYARMRQGEKVILEPKKVLIHAISILKYEYPYLSLVVTTGSGVYIRSLARDIGEDLRVGGYVTALKRTRVGTFTLDEALDLDKER